MSGSDEMKPASPGVKLTYDDFLLFPDDGKRHELIGNSTAGRTGGTCSRVASTLGSRSRASMHAKGPTRSPTMPPAMTRERNDRTGCAVQPAMPRNGTTVRAAGRER